MALALALVLLPFLGSVATLPLHRGLGKYIGWWSVLLALAVFLSALSFLPQVVSGKQFYLALEWMPLLNVRFSLLIDGLSLLFTLIISGMGLVILAYSNFYLSAQENLGRFYSQMLFFMGSMIGLVLSSNLILLFVFWELTSLSSFLLIGFWDREEESRQAAVKALLITGAGGLAMLAGFIILFQVTGSFELREVLAEGEKVRASLLYVPATLLILAGAFTKSAQFPFHNWLPSAMVAPTPVSAYLHSAAMVKGGIFLLARLFPLLGGTPLWFYLVSLIGLVSLVLGAYHALRQVEMKALLAYSTVSQLGLMTALLGYGTTPAVVGALLHFLNHALFKGALFLISGVVDHATGTRLLRQLGGLARRLPHAAAFTGVTALAMAGVPPLNGFLSKELFFKASLDLPVTGEVTYLFPLLAVLGTAITPIYALRFFHGVFLGAETAAVAHSHRVSAGLLLPIGLPAILTVVIGLFPSPFQTWLLEPAALRVLEEPPEVHIALWPGLNPALLLSLIPLVLGFGIYVVLMGALHQIEVPSKTFADYVYEKLFLGFLVRGTALLFRGFQSGYLRHYLTIISLVLLLLVGSTLILKGQILLGVFEFEGLEVYEYGLAALLIVAALATALARDRMVAIISLGLVGGLVVGVWVIYSAPDLALTQLLIETLSLVLFVLVFVHALPFARVRNSFRSSLRDVAVAASVGVLVTALMWMAILNPQFPSIHPFFTQNALSLGGGRNIVNVIIVDFRGYDTMGEITVLSIAAIALFSLHRLRRRG